MHEIDGHLDKCFLDSIKGRPLVDLPPADIERLMELAQTAIEANRLEDMYEEAVYGMELLCQIVDAQHKALAAAVINGDWSDTETRGKMAALLEEVEIMMRTFDNETQDHTVPETAEEDIILLRRQIQLETPTEENPNLS